MKYVNATELLNTFARYLEENSNDYVSKELVMDNLYDAIESVDSIDK